jgi:tetratricopeptide (TPR) repeat protein
MQNRRANLGLVLPVCFLIFLCLSMAGTAQEARECQEPDSLLQAGQRSEAQAKYMEFLKEHHGLACARQGLTKVAESYYQSGEYLRNAGDEKEAIAAYTSALKADPTYTKAREALTFLLPAFARAEAFAKLGLYKDALEAVKEEIKNHPKEVKELTENFQYLTGGDIPFWQTYQRLKLWRELVVVEVVVICLLVLVCLLIRKYYVNYLLIKDFKQGSLKVDFSSDFTAMLKTRLRRLRSGTGRENVSLYMVDKPISPLETLPATLSAVGEPARWISTLSSWLPPLLSYRDFSVSGVLHSPGERGAGVSLQVTQGKKVIASHTLWQDDFVGGLKLDKEGDATTFYHLAEMAAIWILFKVQEQKPRGKKMLSQRLWTDNWESFACYSAALRCKYLKKKTAERHLYIKALDLDPNMRAARVNLARLMWENAWENAESDKKMMECAKDHLRRAQKEAKNSAESEKDSTLYVASYLLVILMVDQEDYYGAAKEVDELLDKIEKARSTSSSRKGWIWAKRRRQGLQGDDDELKQYLDSIRPSVIAMRAGLLAHHGQFCEAQESFTEAQSACDSAPKSDLTYYNLACSYAMAAARTSKLVKKEEDTEQAFDHLERAFWLNRERPARAKKDGCLKTLRMGINAKRFQVLVQKYPEEDTSLPAESPPQLALAELRIIGKLYAEQLNKQGIATWEQLRQHTQSAEQQVHLAHALDISHDLVQRWAALIGLLRVGGIGLREANILSDAQVSCLQKLAMCDGTELAALLSGIATASGITVDREAVMRWVQDAKALQSQQAFAVNR